MLDVYRTCYKLNDQPFRLSPDHRFCFGHRTYDDARSYLEYAINEGEGFVVITGAPGTGKTTLIGTLLSEIDEDKVSVAMLTNTQLDTGNLLKRVAHAFDLATDSIDGCDHLWGLEKYLVDNHLQGRRSILIVDEAQGLDTTSLEDLRLLSNLQYNHKLLLQVFLVGQESLLDKVRAPGMEQLHQRLIAASHLQPLDPEDTESYVEHRLKQVGWNNDPELTPESLGLIHKFSGGVPRRINLICHRLFLRGGLEDKHRLDGQDALHVIVELHKEGLLTPVERRAFA